MVCVYVHAWLHGFRVNPPLCMCVCARAQAHVYICVCVYVPYCTCERHSDVLIARRACSSLD